LVVVAASDAASANNASPATWTTHYCESLLAFGKAIEPTSGRIENAVAEAGGNFAAAKAIVVKNIKLRASAAGHMAEMIERAGVPSVPNGKKLSAALVNGSKTAEEYLLRVAKAANSVSTTPAEFMSEMSMILSKLQVDPMAPVFESANKYDQGQLDKALKANPKCASLMSQ
jgi:hypothetical protein